MSAAAKITFGVTTVLSVATVAIVYQMQYNEREALKLGPIKDAERMRIKRLGQQQSDPVQLTAQQLARQAEYDLQKTLNKEYSQIQPLSDDKSEK